MRVIQAWKSEGRRRKWQKRAVSLVRLRTLKSRPNWEANGRPVRHSVVTLPPDHLAFVGSIGLMRVYIAKTVVVVEVPSHTNLGGE